MLEILIREQRLETSLARAKELQQYAEVQKREGFTALECSGGGVSREEEHAVPRWTGGEYAHLCRGT